MTFWGERTLGFASSGSLTVANDRPPEEIGSNKTWFGINTSCQRLSPQNGTVEVGHPVRLGLFSNSVEERREAQARLHPAIFDQRTSGKLQSIPDPSFGLVPCD